MGRIEILFANLHRHSKHIQPGRDGRLLFESTNRAQHSFAIRIVATHGNTAQRIHAIVARPRHRSQQQQLEIPGREALARHHRHGRRADRRQRQGGHKRVQSRAQVARQEHAHNNRVLYGRARDDELSE